VVAVILPAANVHAGRWISRDPMEVQEHLERDPRPFLDLNPYTFVGNNPVSRVDPYGLWWWDNDLIQVGGPQLLHDIFIGNTGTPVVNPNSLLAQHGVDLSVTGGQLPGNFIASQAGEVGKNSLMAMAMITPIGGEEGAYASASKALEAARAARAASKCRAAELKAVEKLKNILTKNFKPGPKGDISGAISDMVGNPIPKPGGGTWDHVQDLGNILRGLENNVTALKNATDPAALAVR
jgi:hypothetical protein